MVGLANDRGDGDTQMMNMAMATAMVMVMIMGMGMMIKDRMIRRRILLANSPAGPARNPMVLYVRASRAVPYRVV